MSDHEDAKYRPLARLGQGGMAQVFLAIASGPVGFSKLVVIKEIRDEFADDPEFVSMFLDEARLAARLNHPNVVQTTEVGVDGRRYFICMEYLEGQPLNRIFARLAGGGELTRAMKVRLLVDALAGLHHAHEVRDLDGSALDIVHRDATPHNVFLTYSGQVKVVDFGIAKALSSSTETRTGVLKGKVHYMAPEQAEGEKVDRRADVFSAGMMLWESLAGHRPFRRMPDAAVMNKIIRGDIPSPFTVDPALPAPLEAICMKALAHDRDARFATAADMATALEEALESLGDRTTVRDAAKVVDRHFAEDRDAMKRLVESQVALIQRASEGRTRRATALPVVDYDRPESPLSAPVGSPTPTPPPLGLPGLSESAARDEHPSSSITAAFTGRSDAPARGRSAPRPRGLAWVAAVLVIAVAATAGVLQLRGGHDESAASPPIASASASVRASRQVTIDSMPQGAAVRDGDALLGSTPLILAIDPSAPPRRLVMSLPGYAPHTFVPTADDGRILFPLAPLAPSAAPSPAKPEAKPRPRPRPLGDDINTAR